MFETASLFFDAALNFLDSSGGRWTAELAICSTLLLLLAWLLTAAIRPWSAAVRHRVWFMAFCGLALLPLALCVLPSWHMPILPREASNTNLSGASDQDRELLPLNSRQDGSLAPDGTPNEVIKGFDSEGLKQWNSPNESTGFEQFQDHLSGAGPTNGTVVLSRQSERAILEAIDPPSAVVNQPMAVAGWGAFVWCIGLLVFAFPIWLAAMRCCRIAAAAQKVDEKPWQGLLHELRAALSVQRPISLIRVADRMVPMTWGVAKPVIALPAESKSWSVERRRAVLLHELAHIKRSDVLIQTISRLVCCAYWFHPLAWVALRKLRNEREVACDDCVIASGQKPSDYAEQLVHIARTFKKRPYVLGVAIASTSKLEHRILSLLDFARSHVPVSRGLSRVLLIGGLTLIVALSTVRLGYRDSTSPIANRNSLASSNELAPDLGDKSSFVRGRVLKSDGEPANRATVHLVHTKASQPGWHQSHQVVSTTVTDKSGKFEFELPLDLIEQIGDKRSHASSLNVVAIQQGAPADWRRILNFFVPLPRSEVVLRFPNDTVPINGRILDPEGGPIPDVTVRTYSISQAAPGADIEDWLRKAKDNPESADSMQMRDGPRVHFFPSDWNLQTKGFPAFDQATKTGRDGRFELRGFGNDREVVLEIEGPEIAKCRIMTITRQFEPVPCPTNDPQLGSTYCYGATFDFVPPTAQEVFGVVRDQDSGEPIKGVKVDLAAMGQGKLGFDGFIGATTDNRGKFRLKNARRPSDLSQQLYVDIVPPFGQPYFRQTLVALPLPDGLEPIEFNLKLKKAVWVSGTLTDKLTGKPVTGQVRFLPFLSNANAEQYPSFRADAYWSEFEMVPTDANGRFKIPAVPGKGVVIAVADEPARYKTGVCDEEGILNKDINNPGHGKVYHLAAGGLINTAKTVEVDANAGDVQVELTPLATKTIRFVDQNGKQVNHVRAVNVFPRTYLAPNRFLRSVAPSRADTIDVYGLEQTGRLLLFYQQERDLGKAIVLKPDSPDTVVLEPCAKIIGKTINLVEKQSPVFAYVRCPDLLNSASDIGISIGRENRIDRVPVAEDGSFEVRGILPGYVCVLSIGGKRVGKLPKLQDGNVGKVEPGQIIDVGTIDVSRLDGSKKGGRRVSLSAPNKKVYVSTDNSEGKKPMSASKGQQTTKGQVIDDNGDAVSGAHVAVIGTNVVRESDWSNGSDVIAQSKSDQDGRFKFDLTNVSSTSHRFVKVVARKPELAIGWAHINPDESQTSVAIKLRASKPINVKIVDIEGQPADGVRLAVQAILKRNAKSPDGSVWFRSDNQTEAWFPNLKSANGGRLVIEGVPVGYGVYIDVEGDDQFAPQHIALNTGMEETRGDRDGTYRPLVKNVDPGQEVILPLTPAKVFTGTVRYQDTGEPVANTRIAIWASQQEYGSMMSVFGKTDERGQYKITPHPGVRFGVTAFAPSGKPYLARQVQPIVWNGGDVTKTQDVSLPRGILAKGTVVERGSKKPVKDAWVQYVPEQYNNEHYSEDIVTEWQAMTKTDAQGDFQLAVLPGPGRILVHGGPDSNYVFQVFGDRELYSGKPGGDRNYIHASVKLNLDPGKATIDLDPIELQPGGIVLGTVVDRSGEPVERLNVVSTLNLHPYHLSWHGQTKEQLGAKLKLTGLADECVYTVHLLEPRQKLGATIKVQAGDRPRVELKPCGRVKAKFVNKKTGKPLAGYPPTLEIVMTPAKFQYDLKNLEFGSLSPDADFVANVDRPNHGGFPTTDSDGTIAYEALIPGATYRFQDVESGMFKTAREFVIESGKTLDLGELKVNAGN